MQYLLRTKLFVPTLPSEIVARPQLVDRLHHGRGRKLSLVVAPAGYGKTTLITTWLQQLTHQEPPLQSVWLSLAPNDNDPHRFFTYFVGALNQLDSAFGQVGETFLQNVGSDIAIEPLLIGLLNQLDDHGRPILFVLDDYHEIEDPLIHEALSFWLDNQHPDFHLVITSRTEPPLPLPRMRVRRQVTDIDAKALRFSRQESADFLNDHMRLNLAAQDIEQLNHVTEGWVASLQLAALSLQSAANPAEFIRAFKGDNRYIVDYLVSEVLSHQPQEIRDFLLQTSVLERLSVSLCNAVTGQEESQKILETLGQARLFLIPLDEQRHWFRYHHLFADCLRAEFAQTDPIEMRWCHERASHWLAEHALVDAAIEHAFLAENHLLAAGLLEENARRMLTRQGEPQRLWRWMQQLAPAVVQSSPRLLIASAWIQIELYSTHDSQIDALLEAVRALIQSSGSRYSDDECAIMATEVALIAATVSRLRGDLAQAIVQSERAVALIQDVDYPILQRGSRGTVSIIHFLAGNITRFLELGEFQLASIELTEPLIYVQYVFLSYTIDAHRLAGRAVQAEHMMSQLGTSWWPQANNGAAMLAISWAAVLYERNQLDNAAEMVKPAIDQLRVIPSMGAVVQTGAIVLAKIWAAQGKHQDAIVMLRGTDQNYQATDIYYPSARIPATIAWLHLQQGRLAVARRWAEENEFTATDPLDYLFEIDHLVLASLFVAEEKWREALQLLEKLEGVMLESGRIARLIQLYILRACIYHKQKEPDLAVEQLVKANVLAEPAQFVRPFLNEQERLSPIVQVATHKKVDIMFASRLLMPSAEAPPPPSLTMMSEPVEPLLNPLTERELATLRHLASDMTIPEIAEQMFVAPSTVRTYVKRLYSKLDTHSRIEAVNRGRALKLI